MTITTRPASATHALVAACGVTAFLTAVWAMRTFQPFDDIADSALAVILATAAGIFLPDLLWQKMHRRLGDGTVSPSLERTLTKGAGLLGTVALFALGYWLFPEYQGTFYAHYWHLLRVIALPWLLLVLPYIGWVDARMAAPEDGLWHMGRVVTCHWESVRLPLIGQHLLGWLVKAFFLPLMFTYLCNDLQRFMNVDVMRLQGFTPFYDWCYDLFYFIDVGMVSLGYMCALKLCDTHIRSAEPTAFGWGVALLCYEPFWSLVVGKQYLAYDPGYPWGARLHDMPVLYTLWGCLILALVLVYVWATVAFGARFSNLTHRGIITSGPYRWTKHPAYIAKNLSWWLISLPFLFHDSWSMTARHTLMLLGLNLVYFLRAKTEERHLARDPVYVQYAQWIEENGLFRFVWPRAWRHRGTVAKQEAPDTAHKKTAARAALKNY